MATSKSAVYWAQRKPSKSGKPIRWERLLMVLGNGGVVTLKEIEDTMEYAHMYRISCEMYILKEPARGGIIKVHKQGRKVVAYELINAQELVDKFLTPKGLTVTPIVGRESGINKLADLDAKAETKVKTKSKAKAETLEVEEITD